MMIDPIVEYYQQAHGRAPSLMEWMEMNFRGDIPEPLCQEDVTEMPAELLSQYKDLPGQYVGHHVKAE